MIGASPYATGGYTVVKLEPHLHTLHSDGQATVAAMFAACKTAGYDAVALTDHNTSSGIGEAEAIARDLGLIFVPGVEVTSFRGHAVALGVSEPPEWRDLEHRGADALASEVHTRGGVLSVAHPVALGSPVCSGCAWEWPIQPGSVDLWELLSAARPHTEVPLELWRQLLARGGRIGPVGAGDVHSIAAAEAPRPATSLFVRERTRDGVLEALRARRLCASAGPLLELWLEGADGQVALVGDCVTGEGWTPRTRPSAARVGAVALDGLDGRRCVYAELDDDLGQLQAVTAPIWMRTSH